MGLLKGLVSIVTSPVTAVAKTTEKVFTEEWEARDLMTLGITKVVDSLKDTAEEVENDFSDDD